MLLLVLKTVAATGAAEFRVLKARVSLEQYRTQAPDSMASKIEKS
jgi:hypothetical protein